VKKTVFLNILFVVILLAVVRPAQAQDEQSSYREQFKKVIINWPVSQSGIIRLLGRVGWNSLGPQFIPVVGFSDPNAVPFLLNVLQNGPDWSDNEIIRGRADMYRYVARCYAALCLGYIGDSRAFDPLLAVLNNKNIETYPHRPDSTRDREYNLRAYTAFALGYLGDRRAVDPLIKSLREDGFVECIYALTRLHDFRAIRPIIQYASRHNQSDFGHSIHRCLEIFTGARFPSKYSSESRKCTVLDFPELGELEPNKAIGILWKHWLKEGDRLAKQRIEEYSTCQRLLMEKKLDAARKFYHNGSPRSKLSRCGIAALPYIMDAIEKGDSYLVPIIPELTRGHQAKALHLSPGLSNNAKRAEALEWWKKNKQKWFIFQPTPPTPKK